MRQQIAERDRSPCRFNRVERPVRIAEDAQVCELRRAHRDRIVQGESPFVEQHQGRDRRHRLGHRRDTEDGVALDWKPARQVAAPHGDCVDDLAVAPRQRRGAGELSRVDELPDSNLHSVLAFHIEIIK
jgi:hypothetical protein